MKKTLLLTAILLGATAASQAGVSFNIGIGIPLPGVVSSPPVAYQAPPVVYQTPAPVYYAPRRVVYAAPPVVYAPARVIYSGPPVVYPAPVAVCSPSAGIYVGIGSCGVGYRYGWGYCSGCSR